ncbi:MAG: hypothetical protein AB1589_02695 [Cyanobacteriota bacterium]
MNDEQLATLGVSLQRDFQVLMQGYITGWLDENYLTGEDVQELSAIAWDINRVFQVSEQLLDLEQRLSSGFVPEDLALQNDESGGMETETIAPGSSWFSENLPNSSPSSPNPFSPGETRGVGESSALLPSLTPLFRGGRGDEEGMGMKSFNDRKSNGLDISNAAQLKAEYPQGKISISAPPASDVDKAVQTIGHPSPKRSPSESFADGVAKYEDGAYGEGKMSTLENECDRPSNVQRPPVQGLKALAGFIASEYPDGVVIPQEMHKSQDSPAAERISSLPPDQKKHQEERQNPQLDNQKAALATLLDEQLSFQSQVQAAEDLTLSPLANFENRNAPVKNQISLAGSQASESSNFPDLGPFSTVESAEEKYTSDSDVQPWENLPNPTFSSTSLRTNRGDIPHFLSGVRGDKTLSQQDWAEEPVVLPRVSGNAESNGVDKGEILVNQEAIASVNATEEIVTPTEELSGMDMDVIMQAIAREVEREYKRFYGDS